MLMDWRGAENERSSQCFDISKNVMLRLLSFIWMCSKIVPTTSNVLLIAVSRRSLSQRRINGSWLVSTRIPAQQISFCSSFEYKSGKSHRQGSQVKRLAASYLFCEEVEYTGISKEHIALYYLFEIFRVPPCVLLDVLWPSLFLFIISISLLFFLMHKFVFLALLRRSLIIADQL